jgi:hypothetical protein
LSLRECAASMRISKVRKATGMKAIGNYQLAIGNWQQLATSK